MNESRNVPSLPYIVYGLLGVVEKEIWVEKIFVNVLNYSLCRFQEGASVKTVLYDFDICTDVTGGRYLLSKLGKIVSSACLIVDAVSFKLLKEGDKIDSLAAKL